MSVLPAIAFSCGGCSTPAALGPAGPLRCARAGHGDIDHVMTRTLDTARLRFPRRGESNPFIRYRELLTSYEVMRGQGREDAEFVALAERLDHAVAEVDGGRFRVTPFHRAAGIEQHLGLSSAGAVWIKDETGNVSGTHKGRHLMGIALYLESLERVGCRDLAAARLAISSCGNAALAAAVVARALGRELDVFVPADAEPVVLGRLRELGARISTCPRTDREPGDPCLRRFRRAIAEGALPFGCQGSENGLTIEGGSTLTFEIVSSLSATDGKLDRLIVQVGGGALASACIRGLREAVDLEALDHMPRIHAVQTQGAHPLARAHDLLLERIRRRVAAGHGTAKEHVPSATPLSHAGPDCPSAEMLSEELRYAATHRSEFMWPWEKTPRSIASAILDDETYDWLAVVGGMIETGGRPIVVSEETLIEANRLARAATGVPVSPTGSAGLAGLLELHRRGELGPDETVAVLFTGGDPGTR